MASTLSSDVISLQAQVEHLKSDVRSCCTAAYALAGDKRVLSLKSLRANCAGAALAEEAGRGACVGRGRAAQGARHDVTALAGAAH